MDEILIPAIVVGLIAAYPGWIMSSKAFFTSRFRVPVVIACVVAPFLIAIPFFYLPFWLAKGQERESVEMMIDFAMWGVCPVALIGLVAYVMDHIDERPLRCLIAGAACFALALLPIAYYFFAEQLQADFGITITSEP